MKNNIVAIDIDSLLRASKGKYPDRVSPQGNPIGELYYFISMVRNTVLENEGNKHLYAFTASTQVPEDVRAILQAMGLDLIEFSTGKEAVSFLSRYKRKLTVVTENKDFGVLLTKLTTQLKSPLSGELHSRESLAQEVGLDPKLLVFLFSMLGNETCEMSSVPNVGPALATKIIGKVFDKNTSDLSGVDMPLASEEKALVSSNLQSLTCEVLAGKVGNAGAVSPKKRRAENTDRLNEIYKELGMVEWLPKKSIKVNSDSFLQKSGISEGEVHIVSGASDLEKLLEKMSARKAVVINGVGDGELAGLSIGVSATESYYIPLAHNYKDAPSQLPSGVVLGKVFGTIKSHSLRVVTSDSKYLHKLLYSKGIHLPNVVADCVIGNYLLNPEEKFSGLSEFFSMSLNKDIMPFSWEQGSNPSKVKIESIATELHICNTLTLESALDVKSAMLSDKKLYSLYSEVEIPLQRELAKIEAVGVSFDLEEAERFCNGLKERIDSLNKFVQRKVGMDINPNSPQSVLRVLRSLGLEKEYGGEIESTGKEVLEKLSRFSEVPEAIMELRELTGLYALYSDSYQNAINPETGKIHAEYGLGKTGRLSTKKPNLQGIPTKSEGSKEGRKCIVASEGMKLLAVDIDQAELVVAAHLSQDPFLLKAFKENMDVHRLTAAQLFDKSYGEVNDSERRAAKAINFGLIYGLTPYGLSKKLDTTVKRAEGLITRYRKRMPKLVSYVDSCISHGRDKGFVRTVLGRRVNVPRTKRGANIASNAPMQGGVADIIKKAMVDFGAKMYPDSDIRMVMQVHDELVFEVEESKVDIYKKEVESLFVGAVKLTVPLKVSIKTGSDLNYDDKLPENENKLENLSA